MSFRPASARWFELVTTNAHVVEALEALALTGAVELEAPAETQRGLRLPDFDDLLTPYRDTARTHGGYWPEPQAGAARGGDIRTRLEEAWKRMSAWRAAADPVIARVEKLAQELLDLNALGEALARAGDAFPDPSRLAGAGPRLAVALYRLPEGAPRGEAVPGLLLIHWQAPDAAYALAIGAPDKVRAAAGQAPSLKGTAIPLPKWLPETAREARAAVAERIAGSSTEKLALEADLATLAQKHALAAALGDFALIEWLREHAGDIVGGARLVYVTGWTSVDSAVVLQRALEEHGVHCLVRLMPDPSGSNPPLILRNPGWVKPFEIFARMLGMPTRDEADPSIVLAFVAPILFGFMFGDVGQGLVLVLVGALYGKKLPVLRLLAPGGAMAMVFGVLFGSVFCSEDILPALWLRPLEQPITLLVVTLAAGVGLMTFGLAIDAAQARWRGASVGWWAHEAGLTLAYLAALASVIWRPALWGLGFGALWFVIGAAALARGDRLAAGGRALAELVEKLMQILVNTISFARVGAFALAHAGLSAAVMGLAHTAGSVGFWIVLLLGNALVLGLEGLVVGIQTTRLMLFEFFIRFLEGGGRALAPLSPPRSGRIPSSRTVEPKRA